MLSICSACNGSPDVLLLMKGIPGYKRLWSSRTNNRDEFSYTPVYHT